MNRIGRLTVLLALVCLALPSLAAARSAGGASWSFGTAGPEGFGPGHPAQTLYAFRGEVVSVDATAGTIEARLVQLNPREGEPSEEPFTGTLRTDEGTQLSLNGEQASVADLEAGDQLAAAVAAEQGLTREQALERPAELVSAYRIPAIYGFVGRVRAVDPEAGTLTLAVRHAIGTARDVRGRIGVVTFRTDAGTELVRDGRRVELADLERGDLAGVAIVASRHDDLDAVLATPARAVVAASPRFARRHGMRRHSEVRLGSRAVRSARR